jgi:hypothetical protein
MGKPLSRAYETNDMLSSELYALGSLGLPRPLRHAEAAMPNVSTCLLTGACGCRLMQRGLEYASGASQGLVSRRL